MTYTQETRMKVILRGGKYVAERIKGCVLFPNEGEGEPTMPDFGPDYIARITEVGAIGEIAGYVEPWVGYSQEAATKNLITGITLNTSMISRNPELFTGTFTYIGERYAYVPGSGVSSNYVPVWTNGKKVIILEVLSGSSLIDYITPNSSIPSVSGTYILEASKSPYRSGCITRQGSGVGNYVSQFLTADTEVNQVSYNKAINRIYLTWDGSSTVTYEDSRGNQYTDPAYVIDTALTTTEISRAEVYVNGEYQYTLPDWNNSTFIGPGQTSSMSRYLGFGWNTNGTLIYRYYINESVS